MKTRRKRWIWILLAVVITPFAVLGIWFNRQVKQQRLDSELIKAIKKRDTPKVISLLDAGADPNATDRPYKPLTLKSLITDFENRLRGNAPATETNNPTPALMLVYGRVFFRIPGEILVIVAFVNTDIPDELSRDHREDPALLIAALLDHGARLDKKSREGEILLEYASECGDTKTVKLLLKNHVNPNEVGRGGEFPPEYPPLIYAHNYECVRLLLEAGADANALGTDGRTRLIKDRDVSYRSLLLEHGADPNAQDNKGITPLMNLVGEIYLGNDYLRNGTRTLIQHGAKVSLKDNAGLTVLDYAGKAKKEWRRIPRFSWDRYENEVIQPLRAELMHEQAKATEGVGD